MQRKTYFGYLFKTAAHWHMRAEEMRALTEEVNDPAVRRMMLGIAADYESRAEEAEDREAQHSNMFRVAERPEAGSEVHLASDARHDEMRLEGEITGG
jgi:hypothetical protein